MSALNNANQLNSNQAVFIFGTGNAGKAAYENLKDNYSILGFGDSDKSKQNSTLFGLPILSANEIAKTNADILIASEFFEQIKSHILSTTTIHPDRIKALPAAHIKPMTFGSVNQQLALAVLSEICEQFEASKLVYHLDAGTLLGLYRDGRLIPWDDDLDIALNADSLDVAKLIIPELCVRLGDLTQSKWQATEYVSEHSFGNVAKGQLRSIKLAAQSAENVPSVDLFIKYVGNEHSDYCLASRGIRMPAELSQITELKSVANQLWRMPADTPAYLKQHYGKDWQTPDPDWCLSELSNATVFAGE